MISNQMLKLFIAVYISFNHVVSIYKKKLEHWFMRYFDINVYSTKIRCIFFFLTKYFLIYVQIVLAKSFKVKKVVYLY
jgi:hypothetical protein